MKITFKSDNKCKSSLRADFTVNGKIIYTLMRSCGNENEEDGCESNLDIIRKMFFWYSFLKIM